ncbi:hypothetical protein [Flagellimonas myxillae]|uniref:hypothetical protein n=1 Tax=Flagellimonas myxillae TaxID=2942214 RepID=UPI00201F4C99|nr:hypothetical protein [Muricauda myxillae]MCL6267612.1 hypothetical protein [Muricauda myxillae]
MSRAHRDPIKWEDKKSEEDKVISKQLHQKAHLIFWSFGIILIALQVLFTVVYPDSILDINVHDTYLVIAYAHLYNVLGTWFILCGLGYWILKLKGIPIIKWMFWLHLVFTLLFPLSFGLNWYESHSNPNTYQWTMWVSTVSFFGLVLFVLVQVFYFLNILISTLRKIKSR